MEQINRLRALATHALERYANGMKQGQEMLYPQWAKDVLDVCDVAERNLQSDELMDIGSWTYGSQVKLN